MHQTLTRTLLASISSARLICVGLLAASQLNAGYLDDIGLTALRARDASLDGSGVDVGQAEAEEPDDDWQTDPANVGLSSSLFTYYNTGTSYPTGASFVSSLESGHANTVAGRYYSDPSGTDGKDGVAPGVASIGMFNANYFYNSLIRFGTNVEIPVINQSFVFPSQDNAVDQNYDDYAAAHKVLFCNGINTNNNPSTIPSPASSYNGITVGTVNDSVTPLADGRSKPDIVAPGSNAASYTTPLVAGAAAILIQSGNRGDAGSGTESNAVDPRTLKALLLNSATKPSGWSHTSTHPLDTDSGAGILEVNQAQLLLAAGQYAPTQNEVLTEAGTSHLPPNGETENLASYSGWNLGTLTNTTGRTAPPQPQDIYYDVSDNYYFDLSSGDAAAFYLNATLVWNRQSGRSSINNLDLFLYTADGSLVASSVSSVDNVEHIYTRHLAPGRYVLQIHKPYNNGRITDSETYALAFNFRAAPTPGAPGNLNATAISSSEIDISWTDTSDDETGYRVERRPNGGTYGTVATLAADSITYSDAALSAGSTYEYRITAFNAEAESSATTSATTLTAAPVAPSNAIANVISASEIDLSWTDNSSNETGYRIERRISGGSYSTLTTLAANTNSYTDSTCDAATSYEYQIIAFNDDGDSPAAEASSTTYSLLENWRFIHFGTTSNSGTAADTADPELDGLANLLEFATGTDPNSPNSNPLDISSLGNTREFSFTWRTNSTLDFSIGYSEDLNTGFTFYDSATLNAGSSPKLEFINSAPIDSEFETLTYGIRDSVTSDNAFIQLQVNTTEQ
jgi:hypothetical protein